MSAHGCGSTPFTAVIRTAGLDRHTEAKTSTFIADLLGGRLEIDAYTRCTEQLRPVHRALEDAAAELAGDRVAGPFRRPGLLRVAALERDVDHLRGPGRRDRTVALPETLAHAARIAGSARTRPAGYVAHHHTGHHGGLSGGRVVRGVAERTRGLGPQGRRRRFHVFEAIGDAAAFKRGYRRLPDALPVDDLEKQRVVEECRRAFAPTTAVFAALGRELTRTA
ncbi:biliverdin-producing heme oxygenase [Streptomyces sp. ME03-5709C]|nr:biliverdin-producing heme oxygenase [Streptomyces sp. ME03-5709C]